MDDISAQRYQVYAAHDNDITWTRDNYAEKEKVISLIVKTQKNQSNNEAEFKVLEMQWNCVEASASNDP